MTAPTLSFRPDRVTLTSLEAIFKLTGVRDRSTVLREAIRVYEEQLQLARVVAACEKYAAESVAMADSFDAADGDLAARDLRFAGAMSGWSI